ncbi:UDP-N-acetylmuramoyl-tripeptide--D-alanyl-D-alanine ligase [Lactovum miscens]|uniref:UDP-N-acetylmuramoyl-tripeptide--D-alanyl-D-alanine ligase n=1 Tax=Lactovum miscens TaxID=190387 RepID=A0A841C6Q5_9LACT|nr:UDP-N-acetylmuramoyl-tripeptide--D-alanyl-D-alanine ligase [Lactovum miscens]MBB5887231.1 UDP-N-acetylmuramoyl-tripeptide--D-alanyl-D-alanine ligase [Lactovum miscens]
MNLTLHEIGRAVHATNDFEKYKDLKINKLEFDSRKIESGDVFLPLKGEHDGHDFIKKAFLQGALVTLTQYPLSEENPFLQVADTKVALQGLAHYYLKKENPDVISITGSNGKTTTKDMTAAVLATHYRTYKTQGNNNNEIGLPYTILSMPEDTEKLVLEMGMDRPGDIVFLSELANPKIALITLIGESHLEFFGTRKEIARGKMGITAGLKRENVLVAPADPIIDEFIPEGQKIVRFGKTGADLYVTKLTEHKENLTFETNFFGKSITIPVPGKFNANNAMLAAYVGKLEGVPEGKIHQALSSVQLTKNRTEWLKSVNGVDILSDVYNANPTAMRLILETFQAIERNFGGRKVVVLADMLELGEHSAELHASISAVVQNEKLDKIFLYGPMMKNLAEKLPEALYFTSFDELSQAVQEFIREGDQILIKGSNGMGLAKLVEILTTEEATLL